jgi:curved DNA-binding protein CbpA
MPLTLYDVLELKPDCDAKEIRVAFIKLSKLHHPDASSRETSTHTNFVKINEAYSILSRPDARREYDISLKVQEVPYYSGSTSYRYRQSAREEFIFRPGQGFRGGQNEPYYGIKGLKKLSNSYIVWACIIFTAIGAGLQVNIFAQKLLMQSNKNI